MNCEKCHKELNYGANYCIECGEKIDTAIYQKQYDKTIWGLLDKLKNWWDTVSLKKITDHLIFKTLALIGVIVWAAFVYYTNYANIKFLESNDYRIEYNKTQDEYYLRTDKNEVGLKIRVPAGSDNLIVKGYIDGEQAEEDKLTTNEYKNKGIIIKKDEFDYVIVESLNSEKLTDSVKLYVID